MATTTRTGAALVARTLEDYGVTHVFGNPGTTEMPVVRALHDSEIEYVLGLHEDIAVGMAAGYASTRRYHAHDDPDVCPLGVANLHTIAGTTHGTGNLYGAAYAGVPLLVTAGTQAPRFRHREMVLSGDVVGLTEQFTKWSAVVDHVDELAFMLRRAVRTALTPPTGPVFLGLPVTVAIDETDTDPEPLGEIPTAGGGDPGAIDRAAELLAGADEPVLVVGDEVARSGSGAVEACVHVAEAVGARVHGEMLAAEVGFPTGHDQWVSYLPTGPQSAIRDVLDVDVVAFVGCSSNAVTNRLRGGKMVPEGVTCIDVNDDGWELGKNTPADVSILGDAGLVLSGLAERLDGRVAPSTIERRLETVRDAAAAAAADRVEPPADGEDTPVKADVVEAIKAVAPGAYLVEGAYGGREAKYRMLDRWSFRPREFLSNKGSGLGYTVPAAVGAALAEAEAGASRPVVGFLGDGAYLYYPHALYTAARYGVDLVVVVLDNGRYHVLEQKGPSMYGGSPEDYELEEVAFGAGIDLAGNVETLGATAHHVDDRADLEAALGAAIDEPGPSVLDVVVRD